MLLSHALHITTEYPPWAYAADVTPVYNSLMTADPSFELAFRYAIFTLKAEDLGSAVQKLLEIKVSLHNEHWAIMLC